MVKESAEEITGREAKSALEKGEHYNLICIGCGGGVFTDGRTTLQYNAIWEKVIYNELANLAFIYNGRLEQMQVQGGHGREKDFAKARN
jgi:hypothetical protein